MTPLRRVAVLGAGTMGSRIAAHFANAGLPVDLLDIVLPDQPKRNAAALAGIEAPPKQKPGRLLHRRRQGLITPGQFRGRPRRVADCDWIIEAVAENLEIKRNLLAQSRGVAHARHDPFHQHQRHPAGADLPKASTASSGSISSARTSSIRRAICTWWR